MVFKTKVVVVAITALIVLSAAGLAYFRGSWQCRDGAWTATGHPLMGHPQTACVKPMVAPLVPKKVCSPPWSCGILAQGEPGMKLNVWYLKYEDLTGPARLEIVFDKDAVCTLDGVIADCNRMFPPANTTSTFSGVKDGDLFRVSKLEFKMK